MSRYDGGFCWNRRRDVAQLLGRVLGLNFAFFGCRAAGKSAMPPLNIKADPALILIAAPNSSIAHIIPLVA
jgi:hypothetical protein